MLRRQPGRRQSDIRQAMRVDELKRWAFGMIAASLMAGAAIAYIAMEATKAPNPCLLPVERVLDAPDAKEGVSGNEDEPTLKAEPIVSV